MSWGQPIEMYDRQKVSELIYDVVGNDDNGILLRMHGETRRVGGAGIVRWFIRMPNENQFYWQTEGASPQVFGPYIKCIT